MLDTTTIALMLFAGLLHASWHSLVRYGSDQIVVLTGMGLVAGAMAACAVPFLTMPAPSVWPVIGVQSQSVRQVVQLINPVLRGWVNYFAVASASADASRPHHRDGIRVVVSGGLVGLASFLVLLWALSRSPVGAVWALRECSVLFATMIGMTLHGERRSVIKVVATGLIVTGPVVTATARL